MNTDRRTAAWPVVCTVCWSTRTTPRRASAERGCRRDQHDRAEDEEEQRLGGRRRSAREEDRDDDDRPELARDAGAEHRRRRAASRAGRASASIGTSVPSARRAERHPEQPGPRRRDPPCAGRGRRRRRSRAETAQPIVPRTSERRATRCSISSRPAKKNRNTRPRSARKSMWLSISARPSPSGPMRIPSTISSTTVGRMIRRAQPRQNRSGTRRSENEHERPGVRQRRLRSNRDDRRHGRAT